MITAANFKELEDEGYTVVPGALTPADCDRYREMYDQWLTHFPQGKWPKSSRGLIRGFNTGHLDPTWRIRLQVKDVFSQVWKTEKLMTSFDSIAIGRPPEDGEEPFDDENTNWLHLDQEACRDGLHAYQGGVYLEDACEDDWTLQVMAKSHRVFHKFFAENPKAKAISIEKQFFKLDILNKMGVKLSEWLYLRVDWFCGIRGWYTPMPSLKKVVITLEGGDTLCLCP
jgi:hypothetical protein